MTRALTFAIPGNLDTPTGGYVYDRRIIAELRAMGWDVEVIGLGDGFPFPDERVREQAGKILMGAAPVHPLVVDGLALGVLPEAAANVATTHRIVALVHHPLAHETGLSGEKKAALYSSEKAALARVRGVIVTSEATKALLVSEYGVAADAVAVVKPGNEPVTPARGGGGVLSLLSVGSVVPRKGYNILVAALTTLTDLSWTLTIAGDLTRDEATAIRIADDIRLRGLEDRIVLAGAVPDGELARLYSQADVFVLASLFEGYGMALADATAYGLPVIATNAGAIPEAVPQDAAILVPPGDVASLAAALRRVLADKSEREGLACNARAAASRLPRWQDQAILFARAIEAAAA